MGFGEQLRRERERQGMTLDRLCAETKINLRHLTALERDDLRALPGGVFRRGMVKACLGALGLEPEMWLPRFDQACRELLGEDSHDEQAWVVFAEGVHRGRAPGLPDSRKRWAGVAGLFLGLLASGWALWVWVLRARLER